MAGAFADGMSSSISGDLTGDSRILLESMGRDMQAALSPGQRLPARVIEMLLTGDVLLELGRSRVTVPTSTPLQPGDRVRVEVLAAGPTPEFRILSGGANPQPATPQPANPQLANPQPGIAPGKAAVTPQAGIALPPQATSLPPALNPTGAPIPAATLNPQPAVNPPAAANQPAALNPPVALTPRDLPVIMRALAEIAPAGIPVARAAETFLQTAAVADLRPAIVEQIQRALAPLHAALPAADLAPALRTFLAQSGLFTENQLGAVLRQYAATPAPAQRPADQPPVDQRPADQRSTDTRPAAQRPEIIPDVRLLLGALTPAGTPIPEAVRVFGEAILQQQLVVAEQVAATNGGQVAIPFVFGEERVDIRFTWDREAQQETQERSDPGSDRTISLGVFVNLNVFGGIEARIVWKPESFAVTFYVERELTRAIVDAGLTELTQELSASGFSAVVTNVWLNPDRIAAAATPAKRAIPAGTILDVMV